MQDNKAFSSIFPLFPPLPSRYHSVTIPLPFYTFPEGCSHSLLILNSKLFKGVARIKKGVSQGYSSLSYNLYRNWMLLLYNLILYESYTKISLG